MDSLGIPIQENQSEKPKTAEEVRAERQKSTEKAKEQARKQHLSRTLMGAFGQLLRKQSLRGEISKFKNELKESKPTESREKGKTVQKFLNRLAGDQLTKEVFDETQYKEILAYFKAPSIEALKRKLKEQLDRERQAHQDRRDPLEHLQKTISSEATPEEAQEELVEKTKPKLPTEVLAQQPRAELTRNATNTGVKLRETEAKVRELQKRLAEVEQKSGAESEEAKQLEGELEEAFLEQVALDLESRQLQWAIYQRDSDNLTKFELAIKAWSPVTQEDLRVSSPQKTDPEFAEEFEQKYQLGEETEFTGSNRLKEQYISTRKEIQSLTDEILKLEESEADKERVEEFRTKLENLRQATDKYARVHRDALARKFRQGEQDPTSTLEPDAEIPKEEIADATEQVDIATGFKYEQELRELQSLLPPTEFQRLSERASTGDELAIKALQEWLRNDENDTVGKVLEQIPDCGFKEEILSYRRDLQTDPDLEPDPELTADVVVMLGSLRSQIKSAELTQSDYEELKYVRGANRDQLASLLGVNPETPTSELKTKLKDRLDFLQEQIRDQEAKIQKSAGVEASMDSLLQTRAYLDRELRYMRLQGEQDQRLKYAQLLLSDRIMRNWEQRESRLESAESNESVEPRTLVDVDLIVNIFSHLELDGLDTTRQDSAGKLVELATEYLELLDPNSNLDTAAATRIKAGVDKIISAGFLGLLQSEDPELSELSETEIKALQIATLTPEDPQLSTAENTVIHRNSKEVIRNALEFNRKDAQVKEFVNSDADKSNAKNYALKNIAFSSAKLKLGLEGEELTELTRLLDASESVAEALEKLKAGTGNNELDLLAEKHSQLIKQLTTIAEIAPKLAVDHAPNSLVLYFDNDDQKTFPNSAEAATAEREQDYTLIKQLLGLDELPGNINGAKLKEQELLRVSEDDFPDGKFPGGIVFGYLPHEFKHQVQQNILADLNENSSDQHGFNQLGFDEIDARLEELRDEIKLNYYANNKQEVRKEEGYGSSNYRPNLAELGELPDQIQLENPESAKFTEQKALFAVDYLVNKIVSNQGDTNSSITKIDELQAKLYEALTPNDRTDFSRKEALGQFLQELISSQPELAEELNLLDSLDLQGGGIDSFIDQLFEKIKQELETNENTSDFEMLWGGLNAEDLQKLQTANDEYQFSLAVPGPRGNEPRINWLPAVWINRKRTQVKAGAPDNLPDSRPYDTVYGHYVRSDSRTGELYPALQTNPRWYHVFRPPPTKYEVNWSPKFGIGTAVKFAWSTFSKYDSKELAEGFSNTPFGNLLGVNKYRGGDPAKAAHFLFGKFAEEVVKGSYRGLRARGRTLGHQPPDFVTQLNAEENHGAVIRGASQGLSSVVGQSEMISYLETIPTMSVDLPPGGGRPEFNQNLSIKKLEEMDQFQYERLRQELFNAKKIDRNEFKGPKELGKLNIGGTDFEISQDEHGTRWVKVLRNGRVINRKAPLVEGVFDRYTPRGAMVGNEGAKYYSDWRVGQVLVDDKKYYVHFDPQTGQRGLYDQEHIDWGRFQRNPRRRPKPLKKNGEVLNPNYLQGYKDHGKKLHQNDVKLAAQSLFDKIYNHRRGHIDYMQRTNPGGEIKDNELYTLANLVNALKSYEDPYVNAADPPFVVQKTQNGRKYLKIQIPDFNRPAGEGEAYEVDYEVAKAMINKIEDFYLTEKIKRTSYVKKLEGYRGQESFIKLDRGVRDSFRGYLELVGETKQYFRNGAGGFMTHAEIQAEINNGSYQEALSIPKDQQEQRHRDAIERYKAYTRLREYESLLFGETGLLEDFDKNNGRTNNEQIADFRNKLQTTIEIAEDKAAGVMGIAAGAVDENQRSTIRQEELMRDDFTYENVGGGRETDGQTFAVAVTNSILGLGLTPGTDPTGGPRGIGAGVAAPPGSEIAFQIRNPGPAAAGNYTGLTAAEFLQNDTELKRGRYNTKYDGRAIEIFMERFSPDMKARAAKEVERMVSFEISAKKELKGYHIRALEQSEALYAEFMRFRIAKGIYEAFEKYARQLNTVLTVGMIAGLLLTGNPAFFYGFLANWGYASYLHPKLAVIAPSYSQRRNQYREMARKMRSESLRIKQRLDQGGKLTDSEKQDYEDLFLEYEIFAEGVQQQGPSDGWSPQKPIGLGELENIVFGQGGLLERALAT